ncbi:phosphatase PAP2 family protein [Actinomadura atramentaria]|uniref:phosphatase PAP2 family protein n=1 Tax=Actinomadura atramentaria TaxID=1990 RepID=UPI00036E16ED|nr:phosphatase PAP2 family protein [Actinomadura atramentaria]
MWRELLLIALFYTGYSLTRLVLVEDGTGPAFRHAHEILSAERFLGIDVELWMNQALLHVPWLARAANVFYATAHFVVTISVMAWVWRRHPQDYRWLRTSFVLATGVALFGFWLYPLAPPRFLHTEGFVDPVTALHSLGLYSGDASGSFSNQYAAMPSMHAGWSIWCGFVIIKLAARRWVKLLAVLYPATTLFVILSTANHYVLDAVAGIVLIAGSLSAAWLAYHRCPAPLRGLPGRAVGRVAARVRRGATARGGPAGDSSTAEV